ncbi:InlB B-repeat-containing protein [Radiobacillus sp. PE A8.2]|uniref:InlB B-repeat-containing protein n=1 Tax=Radiobacillus sp. PE A8.2 TaxID=3380349 RepID=UPI003890D8EF
MNRQHRKQWNKWISVWLIFGLFLSMMPIIPNQAEAATFDPITIAQGDDSLGINDQFDPSFWNVGYDASISSDLDRIQLTPPAKGKKGFAYFNDSIRLSEDLSFNAKYTFEISESDKFGADGIAFVIQADSNTAGAEGEGMGYSGIDPSVVVEIDTYENPGIDPSASHIAIMENGDYTNHLASKDLGVIDQDTNLYSVWVDYTAGNMKVYFAKDSDGNTTKPSDPYLDQAIDLQDVFGNTQDVFVGFSSATGGSYSKHEILGVFFDSEYTSSGIKENDSYKQEPKPEAPTDMTVTKTKDEALTVTPKEGKDYVFYEDETAVKPLGSGSSFTIDASMNTDGKTYYYSIIENGVQSERAAIDVEIASEQVGISLNEESSEEGKFFFKDLTVKGSAIKTILISFNKAVSENDKIILPASPAGFTVSDSSKANNYTKRINLSESVTTTDVQNYLQEVAYQLESGEQSVQVVLTSEDVQYDTYYSIDTEHYYQYVTDKVSWTDAYQKAKDMNYMGRTGYLATIMSKEEDIYVNSLSGGEVGWLGGAILKPTSDQKVNASGGTEGALLYYEGFDTDQTTDAWYWMNGPEIGTKFYASTGTRDTENNFDKPVADLDDSSLEKGYYFNWGEKEGWEDQSTKQDKNDWREPNTQIGPNEDSLSGTDIPANKREMVLSTLSDPSLDRVSRQGTDFWWNDRPNNPTNSSTWDAKGYFVEFGNLPVGENSETTVTTFASDTSMLYLPKPDAPSPITITKDIDQAYTVTPEPGPTYYFYENDTDTEAISSGSEFIIDSNMNTNEKRYYYSVKENGIESDRAYIEVLIDDEVMEEDIGIKTSDGITNYTSGVVIDLNLEIEMKSYEALDCASIIINDFELGDSLIFSNQNGISGSYNEDNGVLTLSGEASVEQYEDALQSITFDTTEIESTQRQISFTIGKALYFDPTQHFYEFVAAEGISWQDAKTAASKKSFYGREGYLATVTSAEENNFVTEKSRGAGWLGASDENNEGVWEWVTGPESGQQFWQGDGDGEITNDLYANWYVNSWSEPNNDGNGEDYLHIFGYGHQFTSWATNAIGYWNDFAEESPVDGYLVEYGGLPTDHVEQLQVSDQKIIKFSDSGNQVEVENGTGSGIYQTGSTVRIEAYTPLKGKQFKEWQVASENVELADSTSIETTFTMPLEAVEVKAIYEAIPTYEVTVVDGNGTGVYQAGKEIEISANEDVENGKKFKQWNITNGKVALSEPSQVTTTFVMPSEAITIEAIYTYSLKVKDGSGTGDYGVGDTVNIEADQDLKNGKKFVEWKITSGEVTLIEASEPSSTFTMPEGSVTIEAIYSYALTVENGSGTGNYQAGDTVTIEATEAPEGQRFKEWNVTSENVELADSTSIETTFTMPAQGVEVTANYEDIPSYSLTVEDGSGTGDYQAGDTVMIEAAEAPEGKRFKEWKVTSENVEFADSTSIETTFTMPSEPVTILAIYEQMTEKEIRDQLNEAVNDLTIDTAFDFSEDDTWESITLQFLMLRVGMYETTINWKSSKPNVIAMEGSKATTYRQENDESVILKATVSKAGYSVEKPFLLIAKSNKIAKKESESIKREASIDSDQLNSKSNLIERINLYDSNNNVINKIDKIIVDKELITTKSNKNFSVYLSDDINDLANELAVEINSAALKKVLGNLEVKTDQAIIQLAKKEIERLNENGLDLYFRVVSLRDKLSQEELAKRMHDDKSVQSVVRSINRKGNVKILGTPKEIETNYSGYKTDIILPIGEFYQEDIDLDNIHVYIEHSDGTIEIQKGTITYENDTPVGYKFSVDKFSTFTLFEVEVKDDLVTDPIDKEENSTDGMDNTENDEDATSGTVDNMNDQELSQDQQKNMNSKEENQLPNTALNMFMYLILGVLLFGVGVSMYYFQRRRQEN